MRLYLLLFSLFLLTIGFLSYPPKANAENPNASKCLTINVTLSATNWPGGDVTVSCPGWNPPDGTTAYCPGSTASIDNGDSATLDACDCLVSGGTACLNVSGVPEGCAVTSGSACGTNGDEKDHTLTIDCPRTPEDPLLSLPPPTDSNPPPASAGYSCSMSSASSTGTTTGTATAVEYNNSCGYNRTEWTASGTRFWSDGLTGSFSGLTAGTQYIVTAKRYKEGGGCTTTDCSGSATFTTTASGGSTWTGSCSADGKSFDISGPAAAAVGIYTATNTDAFNISVPGPGNAVNSGSQFKWYINGRDEANYKGTATCTASSEGRSYPCGSTCYDCNYCQYKIAGRCQKNTDWCCNSSNADECWGNNLSGTACGVGEDFCAVKTLTALRTGTGIGYVYSQDGKIACGESDLYSWSSGTSCSTTYRRSPANPDIRSIWVYPIPKNGSSFISWSGCDSVSGLYCYVTPTSNKTVVATFNLMRALTVTKTGSGLSAGIITGPSFSCPAGWTTCSGPYNHNTWLTLSASTSNPSLARLNPDSAKSWTGCDSFSTNTCSVLMNAAKTVYADFVAYHNVKVTKAGTGKDMPGVSVQSSPVASINCGSTCFAPFMQGTDVTLTASYNPTTTVFSGWSGGGCSGTNPTCTISNLTADTEVTATFENNLCSYIKTIGGDVYAGSGITATCNLP